MRVIAFFLFTLLSGLPSMAMATDAAKTLADAKSLLCVFKSAIETSWETDSFQTRPRKGFSFNIEAINTARGNAKAVPNSPKRACTGISHNAKACGLIRTHR